MIGDSCNHQTESTGPLSTGTGPASATGGHVAEELLRTGLLFLKERVPHKACYRSVSGLTGNIRTPLFSKSCSEGYGSS